MLHFSEIRHALVGCWRVALGDSIGVTFFDVSADGFLRSFWVAAVLAVLDVFDVVPALDMLKSSGAVAYPPDPSIGLLLAAAGISLLSFVAFPVVMALLARPFGVSANYVPFITIRNWATLFLNLPLYLIDLLYYLGLTPAFLHDVVAFITQILAILVSYSIARVVLRTDISMSIGFTMLEFVIALFIGDVSFNLLLAGSPG
jgi:hypothetical protein